MCIGFMKGLQFIWDEKKNQANRRKHGVTFEEAQTALFDERAKVAKSPNICAYHATIYVLARKWIHAQDGSVPSNCNQPGFFSGDALRCRGQFFFYQ
jgi:hypothetical protein